MRLSTKGRYALRAMIDLALHGGQGPVRRADIAARQGISAHYIEQLFVKLRQAGLVESVMGPGGGYLLVHRAAEISAGDIIRAAGESLVPVSCIDPHRQADCPRMDVCVTRILWSRLAKQIASVLDSVTLQDLSAQAYALMQTKT